MTARPMRVPIGLFTVVLALAVFAAGRLDDMARFVRYPYELDYGEGIVWQQAVLFFTPAMYSTSTDIPFIVFHYPPLYYVAVRAVAPLFSTVLEAGRAVSAMSTCAMAVLIGLTVWQGARPRTGLALAMAVATGLGVMTLAATRSWGDLMRVDMLAFALAFGGLLVAGQPRQTVLVTATALLLCTAAVFTKHTCLASGVAVAVLALAQDWRRGIVSIAAAGSVGVAAAAYLHWLTGGGFFTHIVWYNVHPWTMNQLTGVLSIATRDAIPIGLILCATVAVIGMAIRGSGSARRSSVVRLHCVHLLLCSAGVLGAASEGSGINYLIEWYGAGFVAIGLVGTEALYRKLPAAAFCMVLPLVLAASLQPFRHFSNVEINLKADLPIIDAVVRQIALADKPVASENMSLIMMAGKRVMFEGAIATELARHGQWNEQPLIDMIERRGFAFMLTFDDHFGPDAIRTPAVDAAMRRAYPRVEKLANRLFLNAAE